jgi:septal ring factor EnvC (AmiA/AmiB activator)
MTSKSQNRQKALKIRADFTNATKNAIAKAAGHRCSNPSCRQNVLINSKVIGQIAHIVAASPNGPRASKQFEKDKIHIKSVANGLLLCHNCAILIDENDKLYTVELLTEWKTKAEAIGNFQQHKSTVLEELKKMEDLMVSYHNSIATEREELTLYENRVEEELDMLSKQLETLKKEKEAQDGLIAQLKMELTIKDTYITNIIRTKIYG